MKLFLLITTFCLNVLSIPPKDDVGGHTGNGGGRSELNMIRAWGQFGFYGRKVLSWKKLVMSEKMLLQDILKKREVMKQKLLFSNTEKYPQFFAGNRKKFYVDSDRKNKIYINQDRLFKIEDGEKVSLNLKDALILILQIISTLDNEVSLGLEKKMREFLKGKMSSFTLDTFKRRDIGIEQYNFDKNQIVLMSDEGELEITKKFLEQSPCNITRKVLLQDIEFHQFGRIVDKKTTGKYSGAIVYQCLINQFKGEFEIFAQYKLTAKNNQKITWSWFLDPNISADIESAQVDFFSLK